MRNSLRFYTQMSGGVSVFLVTALSCSGSDVPEEEQPADTGQNLDTTVFEMPWPR